MPESPHIFVLPPPLTEPSSPPVAPLGYAVRLSHPLTSAIRSLGFACIFLAAVGLARLPFLLLSTTRQVRTVSGSDRHAFAVVFVLALLTSLVNCILQMIAGVSCIRARPSASRRLRIWAWSETICSLLYLTANLYFQIHMAGRNYLFSRTFDSSAWLIERSLLGITVPIFALVMTRSSSFSDAVGGSA
jgi:hypothetical protein